MTAPSALKSSRSGNEALDRLRRQKNWVNFILDQLGRSGEIGKFYYSTSNIHLLSAIITKATGLCAREFANKNLFKPIGIKEIPNIEMKSFSLSDVFGENVTGWIKDPQGINTGGFGLTITPRDMARLAFLYLNKGKWNGKQIIPKPYIESSLNNSLVDYGYLWWLNKEDGQFIYSARGDGGNGIWCVPNKDLVIVTTANFFKRSGDIWETIKGYVL